MCFRIRASCSIRTNEPLLENVIFPSGISKNNFEKAIGGSYLGFLGSYHAIDAKDDEGDREDLAHVEWERGLEGLLDFLGVLDEEAEGEDIGQTEAEVPACADLLGHLLVEYPHDAEE